jgi:hypothetical protein
MKAKLFLTFLSISILFITSCKKENSSVPQVTFTNNITQAAADANGEYTLTGHISSQISLDKVILTKEGESNPYYTDDSSAKNKNEYDYSYLVTGITANTYVLMDVYNQDGVKTRSRFLITKN